MESLEAKAAYSIGANQLFAGAERIGLAVSGGADSMALLAVMQTLTASGTLPAALLCVHANHQLRGSESDDDERFVAASAARMGVPVVARTVDVRAFAREHKLSLETAGRRFRLACFAQVAHAHGCGWIATGHQKDDNAETVVQRLRRGTGFRGLAAMRPARRFETDLWLARPLLDCTRAEIVAYLHAKGIEWREDHTNTDCTYARNFVRHRLLPNLQSQSDGSLVKELSELAAAARRLHARVRTEAAQASQHVTDGDGWVSIDAAALAEMPEIVAVELIRLQLPKLGGGERDMTQRHYANLLQLARRSANDDGLTLPGNLSVRREYRQLVLKQPEVFHRDEPSVTLDLPGTAALAGRRIEARVLSVSETAALKIKGDKGPLLEYLDLDRVGRPLVVRRRRPGDRFQPLGLAHEKKLGKFLTTAKTPRAVRESALVFDDGRRIVWVCPVRISEQVKVSGATQRVLMLRVCD